jgi:hypothetical protein
LIVFSHGEGLGNAFEGDGGFFDVGSAEAEGDTIVGVDFGGNQGRWRLGLRWSGGGQEQKSKRKESSFHDSPLRRS